jgi:ribonucleoside-diphosphate reductase alpha chain
MNDELIYCSSFIIHHLSFLRGIMGLANNGRNGKVGILSSSSSESVSRGLKVERFFTKSGVHPFEEVEWELRTALITNEKGETIFEQKDVEIPKTWSQTATNVVVQKYFHGLTGTSERERSVKTLIHRVARTITDWGIKDGYFASEEDAESFYHELCYILVNQKAAFNSPVWFNVGIEPRPQCSACQPYHALINTVYGLIPIGEIVEKNLIGLPVYDENGLTQIVNTKYNGRKPVYRIELNDGFFIEATGDHLVCAHDKRRMYEPGFVKVEDLKIGMYMRVYSHIAETITPQGSAKDISEAALAGWLQADGFVGQYEGSTNSSLTIEFITVKQEEYKWIMEHLENVFPDIHCKVSEERSNDEDLTIKRIRLYGEKLRAFVERYDLMKRKLDIRVPKPIWKANNDVTAAYLKSLFQADGYMHLNGSTSAHLSFAVISKEWVREIQILLTRLGIYSRTRQKKEKRPDRYDMWEVDISILSERIRFLQKVGFISFDKQGKLLKSCRQTGKDCPEIRFSRIVSIEKIREMEVYDIQTLSGHYLTNGVLVHNCFINSVEDTMESILDLAKTEGMLFKFGSGTGTNFSTLRSSKEKLSGGGTPSGPVSFMRGYDTFAGSIKSGGKCYRKGTLVSTPEGLRPIEQLRIGDTVLTHNGVRQVADFIANGKKQCYRVLTEEGYEVEVTAEHKFAYWSVELGNFVVKPIEEFRPGDQLYILPQPSLGGQELSLQLPEVERQAHETTTVEMRLPRMLNGQLAYLIGLLYGDGNVTPELWRLRWSFCDDETGRQSAEQVRTFCKALFDDEPFRQDSQGNYFTLTFTRKRLFNFFQTNGLLKGKAQFLGFPTQFFTVTSDVRAAFVAGIFDADGNYQPRGGFTISMIDREFLRQLQLLLLTLGIPSKLRLSRKTTGSWQTLYRLTIAGATFTQRFADLIGQYSPKVRTQYIPGNKTDKGWGYRDVKFAHIQQWSEWGTRKFVERTLGFTNETVGYGGLTAIAKKLSSTPVGLIASRLTQCVPVTLASVTPTVEDETYDIEVSGEHLLAANGLYASNTRRAAKMVILNIDHPDIVEFINCKANEEKKAWILIDAGYSGEFNVPGGAYDSVAFQNANHSVRVTDDFMQAVLEDKEWNTHAVTTGKVLDTYKARDLMRMIAESAHICGDPGLQFDTTINDWHTCPNAGRINASNPCSEYMHIDDSACNLSSLNLMRFRKDDGEFDIKAFCYAVDVMILAQDILVDNSSYPTPKIDKNAKAYRQLGLGYANLGALLMARGLPYDSEEGRAYAGAVTALMCGEAYRMSAIIASRLGPFEGYVKNQEPMLRVIKKHGSYVDAISRSFVPDELWIAAKKVWDDAYVLGSEYGYRNSQATVLAPTGTIAFLMDCDTTGIEPDISLVKYKKLVGGGLLKIVNRTVPEALKKLGYTPNQIHSIVQYIDQNDTIEGAPELKPEHLPVFDCAFKPLKGTRSIHYNGHVKMMAAAQPFISGALSKTVNMPTEVTPEDIWQVYVDAWKLGLKAIAIYRDGCKRTQPLSTSLESEVRSSESGAKTFDSKLRTPDSGLRTSDSFKPVRRRLPDERKAITHKFSIAGHEGYITVGMYEDGKPGEIFIVMSKEGSTISGLMDAFATAVSIALQYGVPFEVLANKFSHMRFEPSGYTGNKQIPIAKSIMDYIFRWLALKFLSAEVVGAEPVEPFLPKSLSNGVNDSEVPNGEHLGALEKQIFQTQSDAPPCSECGCIMVRNGSCYKCLNCGATSGCS